MWDCNEGFGMKTMYFVSVSSAIVGTRKIGTGVEPKLKCMREEIDPQDRKVVINRPRQKRRCNVVIVPASETYLKFHYNRDTQKPRETHTFSADSDRIWYCWLKDILEKESNLSVSILNEFPNPYESNSKRWERIWMEFLHQNLIKFKSNSDSVILIGHGSGADAVLRYLEEHSVDGAVIICASDEYHAGERHGREYHRDLILSNCNKFFIGFWSDNDPSMDIESILKFTRSMEMQVEIIPNQNKFILPTFPKLASLLISISI